MMSASAASWPTASQGPDARTVAAASWWPFSARVEEPVLPVTPNAWPRRRPTWSTAPSPICLCASGSSPCQTSPALPPSSAMNPHRAAEAHGHGTGQEGNALAAQAPGPGLPLRTPPTVSSPTSEAAPPLRRSRLRSDSSPTRSRSHGFRPTTAIPPSPGLFQKTVFDQSREA